MKYYLAGPMSGIPQSNFPLFDLAAANLRAGGLTIVSPAELDDPADRMRALLDAPPTRTWGDFLARDVKLIADTGIEGIIFLPQWQKSRGARLEAFVGLLCDLEFACYYPTDDFLLHVSTEYVQSQLSWSLHHAPTA